MWILGDKLNNWRYLSLDILCEKSEPVCVEATLTDVFDIDSQLDRILADGEGYFLPHNGGRLGQRTLLILVFP